MTFKRVGDIYKNIGVAFAAGGLSFDEGSGVTRWVGIIVIRVGVRLITRSGSKAGPCVAGIGKMTMGEQFLEKRSYATFGC